MRAMRESAREQVDARELDDVREASYRQLGKR
jgi:hypothetical protein